ncbi:MAG TPA: diol dehydratase small subunit [Chloroflexota bacterium]
MTQAFSGRALEDITLEAVLAGELNGHDVRIHPDALHHQADVAHAGGNPQLAANLRRAAELTALTDGELIEVYEALRPNRSTSEELEMIAGRLEKRAASSCAALVRDALDAYAARGLLA